MFAAFGTGEEATKQEAGPEGAFAVHFDLDGGAGAGVDAGFGEEQGCRVAFGGMAQIAFQMEMAVSSSQMFG